jgi:hypothetical protein
MALARAGRTRALEPLLGALDGATVEQAAYVAAVVLARAGETAEAERWAGRIGDPSLQVMARLGAARWSPDTDLGALEAAVMALDEGARQMALVVFSSVLHAHDAERADRLLDDAVAPIQAERGHPMRSLMLLQFALHLASFGDARGLRIIDSPEEVALLPLVTALADEGLFDAALAAARTEVSDRDGALSSLVGSLRDAGEHDRAVAVARELRELEARQGAEAAAADGLASAGRLPEAIALVESHGVEALLAALARWAPHLGAQFGAVLEAATEPAGWYHADWAAIHRELG